MRNERSSSPLRRVIGLVAGAAFMVVAFEAGLHVHGVSDPHAVHTLKAVYAVGQIQQSILASPTPTPPTGAVRTVPSLSPHAVRPRVLVASPGLERAPPAR